MSIKYMKLKPSDDIYERLNIKSFSIEHINLFSKKKEMEVLIKIIHIDAFKEVMDLRRELTKTFSDSIRVKMKFLMNTVVESDKLTSLVEFLLDNYKNESIRHQYIFSDYEIYYRNNKNIQIELKSHHLIEQAVSQGIDKDLQIKLKEVTDREFKISFISEKEEGEFIAEAIEEYAVIMEETFMVEDTTSQSSTPVLYGEVIKSRIMDYSVFDQLQVGENMTIEGEVFNINTRELKNDKLLISFNVTNYKDSISCRLFLLKTEDLKLKNGEWVKLKGRVTQDRFNIEDYYLIISSIERIPSRLERRKDEAEVKRVELHAHTNMSEMSGVVSAKDLINRAVEYGHNAIAVTDYGVAYSFPFAYKAAPKDFKVIFGVEAYVVDDEQNMVERPKDAMIEQEEYIIFDIETTGFDPYKDKIIEIGAVKLKGRNIIDRFSAFVNPEVPIPEEIIKLTNITDDMVKDAELIDTVLPRFLEFCGDCTMVAHNAKFDVGFLTQKARQLELEFLPSVIDTLYWARVLITDLKRFNLKALANYFNISLDNHHRAVDDAEATASIFIKMLNMVLSKGILQIYEINDTFQNNVQTADTMNTMILVKNREGLKDLYELISRSHLDFFGERKPRIPKSMLKEKREHLLIASSANSVFRNDGELVRAYLRGMSKDEIEERADFYDYIEIHPAANYIEMVNNGEMESLDIAMEMNKYFYELGKKTGKIVVATGDAHYLEEWESVNRSVLILGSGMGHRSFKHDRKLYFRTTDEMLDAFAFLGEKEAYEVVVENTNKLADMIERLKPIPDGFYPPKIEVAEEEVREMTYNRAKKLYGENLPEILEKRIEHELEAIIGNGFAVLYLIAQKLVKKSLDNGYLVGSRGSVGSSIVAYMMEITEVNAMYPHYRCPNPECKHSEFTDMAGSGVDLPDKNCPKCGTKYIKDGHSIPFEVFMGFKGDKVPDIDLNFSGEYQSEIHRYTEELFGKDHVFRAGTISTLAERNAFGYVKKYFEESGIHKRKAEIERIAKGCEGARKTTGQHPGGMIVLPSDKSIYEFTPIQKPANDKSAESITTHFDYHVMDEQLVKLDILGHDDPTTLRILQDLTGLDIYEIPLDDPKVLSIFNSTEALGVTQKDIGSVIGSFGIPEFGTKFVREMLIETKPSSFAELVRISGLSHGTDVWLNNAQDYVKAGITTLSEVITVRDDIMNYLIDHGLDKSLAFTIMEFVRKGQPSKNKEKWEEYAKAMKEKNIKEWYIESCEKIKYMFPKGHAVAYVMMAVRIAYFKVYYPLEFYTAFLNRKVDGFSVTKMYKKLDELKEARKLLDEKMNLDVKEKGDLTLYEILIEMSHRGIELLPVDIYKSEASLFLVEDGKIRLPLVAVDGLGESVAKKVVEERKISEFISLEDILKRTKLNKTVVELMKHYKFLPDISLTNQQTLF